LCSLKTAESAKFAALDNETKHQLARTASGQSIERVKEGKGKGYTFDTPPLGEETSLQKRLGMARVVKRFHSFTCTFTRLSTNEMNHNCLCLFSRSWSTFTDPWMEG